MNTTVDIYEKYKKQIDELTNVNPELGNFYKSEFLKKEAKRRGFKEGVKFKSLSDNGKIKTVSDKIDIDYYIDKNFLTILTSKEEWINNEYELSNHTIFKDGQWAEIIDEKAELKQEIKELEVKLKELREKL